MLKVWSASGETKFGPSSQWIDTSSRHSFEKIASVCPFIPPALEEFINELNGKLPREKVAFYNRAVPAFESYGENRNGDAFWRRELMEKHATFVSHGHYFRHHVNKDPSIAQGRPIASAFNDQTDMVDLVIMADRDRVEDRIHMLERGEKVATSMGCHVKYDVCSICGNKAATRKQYCKHVEKNASYPFGMRQVLDDGSVCCVFNPNPIFFDLSDVGRGAADESETLMKVASDSPIVLASRMGIKEPSHLFLSLMEKNAGEKDADLIKEVPSVESRVAAAPFRSAEREIPEKTLKKMKEKLGPIRAIRHLSAIGIVLRPREFSAVTGTPEFRAPTVVMVRKAECLPGDAFKGKLDPDIMASLEPWFSGRSAFMPALHNRLSGLKKKATDLNSIIPLQTFAEPVGDEDAAQLYAAYRNSLSDAFSSPDHESETYVSKFAGTGTKQFPDFSKSYVNGVYLTPGRNEKVASFISADDNADAASGPVSGSIADELGQEVLGLMADNDFRRITSRRF
jgi:hypothetical protein